MRLTANERAKKIMDFFLTVYLQNDHDEKAHLDLSDLPEEDLIAFFQDEFEELQQCNPKLLLGKPVVVRALIEKLSPEGLSAICKYKNNLQHILSVLQPTTFKILTDKLDSETLFLIVQKTDTLVLNLILSAIKRDNASGHLDQAPSWPNFLNSPESSVRSKQTNFIEFLKWRLATWKGIKEAKTLAEVISRALFSASSATFDEIPNISQVCNQLICLRDQLDQMIEKNLPTTGSLQESLSFLCKRYINAVTREEIVKIKAKKMSSRQDQLVETKGSIAKQTPSYRDKMHQTALRLLSQPELDKTLLTDKEWLMIGESLLLKATDGDGYLATTKNIPDNETGLPESALVESCHHLRRNAFRCFEQILPQTEEKGEGLGLEEESSEKAGAKNLFISYLGDLQFEDYENKSLLEDQDIQNKLTELDNRAKRVEDFTGWSTFSRALIDYLKEIKPGQETFKTAILKLKYHFELAAGKPDTQKAQQIAAKMKERIFAERNGSILKPSYPKLQQLFNLISVVCSPLAEEKKHEELKTSSSISLFSNPQQLGNDHKEGSPLLNNTDLLSDSMEQKIDPAKTKMIKKLDDYIKELENRSKSWFVIEETKKTLKEKQQLLSVLRQDLLSGCSKEELGSVINVITGNEATNTFCYRRGTSNSSRFFCCISKTGTLKLIEEVRGFINANKKKEKVINSLMAN